MVLLWITFQSFFFYVLGVNWKSYVLHASFFNFIISIITYLTLIKLRLNVSYCLFYSLLLSVLFYPTVGTPFADFHSLLFSLIGIFFLILAIKTKKNFYWFLLPIILTLGFLSKQVPTSYISFYYNYFFLLLSGIKFLIRGLLFL